MKDYPLLNSNESIIGRIHLADDYLDELLDRAERFDTHKLQLFYSVNLRTRNFYDFMLLHEPAIPGVPFIREHGLVPLGKTLTDEEATELKQRWSGISGAWFVFAYDQGPYPIGLFAEEIDALRFAVGLGYGGVYVKFWEFGKSWDEVKGEQPNAT